ncbi:zinc-binding alcohol dehydrogenase family protein [Hymenobacter negativus]|uniref:Zinc-binding dehydrogenase n=1 Tax=Hymenobacter negativus TaxID=2795026 RepID=A0ABS3QJQ5_9BACT|nr:zinc-binding dehydrogenase [Hymenobacter negativus]MBO2011477.1 zinc-binding dehydrogenase [Hymenobacter negativus]
MKAAIMHPQRKLPQYADVPEPVAQAPDQLLLTVHAAAIKQLDRSQARGTHYSSAGQEARMIGGDAVGTLPNGIRVYAVGSGTLAERTLIDPRRMVALPTGLDDATAAALPNAVIGAGMALRFRAALQPGETVLINGATGVTGRVAVQLAKRYGAGRVIATGRNAESLQDLLALGADEVIHLQQADEVLMEQLRVLHAATPIDVIVDYLWGPSAELLLRTLRGTGGFTHRVRFVSVGTMAGDDVRLSGATLRSVDLQLSGSGLGSWPREQVAHIVSDMLPEAFQWAVEGHLHVETVTINLSDIERVWDLNVPAGKRLVALV